LQPGGWISAGTLAAGASWRCVPAGHRIAASRASTPRRRSGKALPQRAARSDVASNVTASVQHHYVSPWPEWSPGGPAALSHTPAARRSSGGGARGGTPGAGSKMTTTSAPTGRDPVQTSAPSASTVSALARPQIIDQENCTTTHPSRVRRARPAPPPDGLACQAQHAHPRVPLAAAPFPPCCSPRADQESGGLKHGQGARQPTRPPPHAPIKSHGTTHPIKTPHHHATGRRRSHLKAAAAPCPHPIAPDCCRRPAIHPGRPSGQAPAR